MKHPPKVQDDLDVPMSRSDHLEAVESAAVFVTEAEELLREKQAVLADALREATEFGLSLRALEAVAGGMSREKVRRIVGGLAWQ